VKVVSDKGIRRLILVGIIFGAASLVYGAPKATDSSGPALWQRAVKIVADNSSSLPAAVHTKVTVTDGSGRVKDSQETWSRIEVDSAGKVVTTVIRSIKDGHDNTENAQKQADRNPGRSRFEYSFLPMMPENQSKVEVTPTGGTRLVDGAECAGFSFVMAGEKNQKIVGTVWIDRSVGAPRLMDFTFEPLPPGATEVSNELSFTVTPEGGWYLASLRTYGVGQILFIHRTFNLEMQFSDYVPYTPRGQVSGTSP
jgi:hypothetical protein